MDELIDDIYNTINATLKWLVTGILVGEVICFIGYVINVISLLN